MKRTRCIILFSYCHVIHFSSCECRITSFYMHILLNRCILHTLLLTETQHILEILTKSEYDEISQI